MREKQGIMTSNENDRAGKTVASETMVARQTALRKGHRSKNVKEAREVAVQDIWGKSLQQRISAKPSKECMSGGFALAVSMTGMEW